MRLRAAVAAGLVLAIHGWIGASRADDYCCICRGQSTGKAMTADDEMGATVQCSLICRRPTQPQDGACIAPSVAATPSAMPAATPAPAPAKVLLYRSDDCSGEALALTQSSAHVPGDMYSFRVESGGPAAAFVQPGFGGAHTAGVGPSHCVSPGWGIAAIRIGAQ